MLSPAVIAGKCAAALSRVLNLGEGLTMPGLVAERIHPTLLGDLAATLPRGSIVVTGTNGKTTTTKLLTEMLARHGERVLTNGSGSNLRRGIASAFVSSSRLFGGGLGADVAVLEVDEAAMPSVTEAVLPRVVVVNNLMRDQLDRHGDLDALAARITCAIEAVPGVIALLNADDPLIAGIGKDLTCETRYFGLEGLKAADDGAGTAGAARCPWCDAPLVYEPRSYSHLGAWRCPACGRHRPALDYVARDVSLTADASAFELACDDGSGRLRLEVGGVHNVYNALAASAGALLGGAGFEDLAAATEAFEPPFGRAETFTLDGRSLVLILAKNPASAHQAFAPILSAKRPSTVGFVLNDNAADGADVSWIWDVGLEGLDVGGTTFVTSGTRAEDAALRLKYAGAAPERVAVESDPHEAVQALMALTPAGGTAHIVATYTAMLDIRRDLVNSGDHLSRLGRSLPVA